jgi:ATP-binding cassette subfamily B protein
MTGISTTNLLAKPAFQQLSSQAAAKLQAAPLVKLKLGQSLAEAPEIPGVQLLLIEGQARLLGMRLGKPISLLRLGPGTFIGAASLLRGVGCETVSAASDGVALAISDELWTELYAMEKGFRHWCNQQLWEAELLQLLEILLQEDPRSGSDLIGWLQRLQQDARLIEPNQGGIKGEEKLGRRVYLGSNCSEYSIGSWIRSGESLPVPTVPFGLRLISLSEKLLEEIENAGKLPLSPSEIVPSVESSEGLQAAPDHPPVSRYSPSHNVISGLKLVRAEGPTKEILACFQMLAQLMKLPFRRDAVEKVVQDTLRRGQTPSLQLCGQLAAGLGLHAMSAKVPAAMGTRLQVPSLIPWDGGFALVVESHQGGLRLASPREGMVTLSPNQLEQAFPEGIELVLVDRTTATPDNKFGPSWFWPAIKRHRGVLVQVLVASFVVQLFTLANPLLIQVIIDKVISQRSLDTLEVLGIALLIVTLLEGVLGSLRTFLFSETTNRIDQRLGAEVIDHLLRLPLGYFDKRPVGELGSRISELEKIRNFLTGQALATALDAVFSVIYIVVMALYSWVLTLIALAVVPIQVGLTLLGAPLFRRQFRQSAEENAKTQSHLVEVLTGIQTVKAQNVEMVSRWKWQESYGRYISRTFEKTITGTALNETSQVLQKISQLLVLWVGARMVLGGELSLGQLIAFRIISGYVTQPLLRLSGIWQSIQELRVSFERLADVIDTPQESDEADKAKIPLPPVTGEVVFNDVSFSFIKGQPATLRDVSLVIKPGTFVGIVGQSGSGKSTLMKLLPRLYSPDKGRILIDGYNIDKVELYSLRRQIGIIPQDPLLFSGTVSENIALTNPEASSESITQAAKLACAHEFIMELPSGYSSNVGERGAGLSGGQRQRVAIARTLLANPKLLVMDEATSALDYDTERRVCENLVDSLKDCTVFFITHRLSTVRRADLIVMMHQGALVEIGSHTELMELKGRYYALYRQQEAA